MSKHLLQTFVAAMIPLVICSSCAHRDEPRMVNVNGYRVRMLLQGHGSPAVVFMNVGFGGSYEIWQSVNPSVSQFTRTVAYNRGGTWKSDPAPLPRDSQHIADELHVALKNAGVKPPYVVVGASLSGIYARVFAYLYPKDVAGIVLLDPTSEDFLVELKKRNQRMYAEAEKQNAEMESQFSDPNAVGRGEYLSLETDYQQARDAFPLPNVPLVLISAKRPGAAIPDSPDRIALDLHEDFVKRIPGARHIVTQNSRHLIMEDDPQLVVNTIREIIEEARTARK
jgi:pimeloyl-ACP methyl ester carboxylesterase